MAPVSDEQLVQALVQSGIIKREQIAELARKKAPDQSWRDALVESGLVKPQQLQEVYARLGGGEKRAAVVDLNRVRIESGAVAKVPRRIAEVYALIPIRIVDNKITVAMADPNNLQAIDQVRAITGMQVEPVQAPLNQIRDAIASQYVAGDAPVDTHAPEAAVADHIEGPGAEAATQGPAVQYVQGIIRVGVQQRASDIHIEPREKGTFVRYRIDGVLRPPGMILPDLSKSVVSAIKVMAEMDVAETRLPQDGRIRGTFAGKQIDIRVSSLPTYFGEKIVMRLLDKSSLVGGFDQLGFQPDVRKTFEEMIRRPQGMVLVTGPTGSGKSTTLYAALIQIRSEALNIITCEDPIEYQIDGINQSQVNYDIGLTFAVQLRHILRQDPDVILVGEIRDYETAEIAFRAALTGHLVLSTLHTNDAPSAITRLVDMKVEPYLISASVIGILAQRLVRRICTHCRQPYQPAEDELYRIGISLEQAKGMRFYHGAGCQQCGNTGYAGRIGVYELMVVTNEIREAIAKGANAQELKQLAMEAGMKTMRDDAIAKIQAGITTVEEAGRVIYEFLET